VDVGEVFTFHRHWDGMRGVGLSGEPGVANDAFSFANDLEFLPGVLFCVLCDREVRGPVVQVFGALVVCQIFVTKTKAALIFIYRKFVPTDEFKYRRFGAKVSSPSPVFSPPGEDIRLQVIGCFPANFQVAVADPSHHEKASPFGTYSSGTGGGGEKAAGLRRSPKRFATSNKRSQNNWRVGLRGAACMQGGEKGIMKEEF
jgi:hypothetical protein